MESRFERQLKKGALEMLVLGLVCAGPTYGYELLGSMARRSNGLFALKEGTLYPILYRLEDDGLIEAQWRTSGGRTAPKNTTRPRRRVMRLMPYNAKHGALRGLRGRI